MRPVPVNDSPQYWQVLTFGSGGGLRNRSTRALSLCAAPDLGPRSIAEQGGQVVQVRRGSLRRKYEDPQREHSV